MVIQARNEPAAPARGGASRPDIGIQAEEHRQPQQRGALRLPRTTL
ncbi:hypothetical protein [Halomonas citrativorans]|uniref:Uncharacterized protein n=1 Tax=Halomonas citrativorans TaxID=2742612 RepID=A0ABR9FFC4_9GAMM|nr:hypothetical protein [Halomonas citrativorans]MBE0405168.1 hypothetical protein [Halomonas citrativorans]